MVRRGSRPNCLSIFHKFFFPAVIDNRSRVHGNETGRHHSDIRGFLPGDVPEQLAGLHHETTEVGAPFYLQHYDFLGLSVKASRENNFDFLQDIISPFDFLHQNSR